MENKFIAILIFSTTFWLNFTLAVSAETDCSNTDTSTICIKVNCKDTVLELTITKQQDDNGDSLSEVEYISVGSSGTASCTANMGSDNSIVKSFEYDTSPCLSKTTADNTLTYEADIWAKQTNEFILYSDTGLIAKCVKPLDGYTKTIQTASIKTEASASTETDTTSVQEYIPVQLEIAIQDSGSTDSGTTETAEAKTIGSPVDIVFELNAKAKAEGYTDLSIKTISVAGSAGDGTAIKLIEEDCIVDSAQASELVSSYTIVDEKRTMVTVAISIDAASQMVYEGEIRLWKSYPGANCASRRKRRQAADGVEVPFVKTMEVTNTDVGTDGTTTSTGSTDSGSTDDCDESQNVIYLQIIVGLVTVNGMNLITSIYFGVVMANMK